MVTRGVHLETTGSMDTSHVIDGISRFMDFRGVPATLTPPSSHGIEWHFNPPSASHFRGIFEIIVKALKRAMKIVMGQVNLNEEAFQTCVSKVMFLL
jgi:hypothetical protein